MIQNQRSLIWLNIQELDKRYSRTKVTYHDKIRAGRRFLASIGEYAEPLQSPDSLYH